MKESKKRYIRVFISGMGRAIDIGATMHKQKTGLRASSRSYKKSIAVTFHDDWQAVGKDLYNSIYAIGKHK